MATILGEITLDVAMLNRFEALVAKQYDTNSRFVKCHIVNQGQEVVVESTAHVVLNALRADGASKMFAGEVNTADNTVTVPLTYWMLELDDVVHCDVSIISAAGERLSTTLFEVNVQYAAAKEDELIQQDENYDLLISLMKKVDSYAPAEKVREGNEALRITAEANRQSAENARAGAETARQTAESARASAETKRQTDSTKAIANVNNALEKVEVATAPIVITDEDTAKTYHAALKIQNGKPYLVYEEL